MKKMDLSLYLVTDRSWTAHQTLAWQVKQSLIGGVTFLQLREKDLSDAEFLNVAIEIQKIADQYHVPFVINDNIEVAAKCGADGVHIGQTDMDIAFARERLGENKIIGVSVHTVEQAMRACQQGADYLGVGAVFPTSTKTDASAVSLKKLEQICKAVDIPVVAIGGINENNIAELKGTGISGVAVISAILSKPDITLATKSLQCALKENGI